MSPVPEVAAASGTFNAKQMLASDAGHVRAICAYAMDPAAPILLLLWGPFLYTYFYMVGYISKHTLHQGPRRRHLHWRELHHCEHANAVSQVRQSVRICERDKER